MSVDQVSSLVRQKAVRGRESYDARAMTLARALRLTVAREAEQRMALPLNVIGLTRVDVTGTELPAALDAQSLLLLLDGREGRVGLAVLDVPLVTGLIQSQTIGTLRAPVPEETTRRFTATDAALCAPFVEAVLNRTSKLPENPREAAALSGWRFAVSADTPRKACLALDAAEYEVVTLTLDMAGGTLTGKLMLILPPAPVVHVSDKLEEETREQGVEPRHACLGESAMEVTAELTIALTRLTLPLGRINGFAPGDIVPLEMNQLNEALVLDPAGRVVSCGTLGQIDGQRAVQVEQRPRRHVHPRRRVTDRAELDLPDVTNSGEKPRDDVDIFGGPEALPDMSDLDFDDGAEFSDTDPSDRRVQAG